MASSAIPEILRLLDKDSRDPEAIDVVLASNMISVGVDISRLGLMVVNGQPKGIAEYIQATSRVGRGKVPGLVVSVYNANKARDRSHYETFLTWHQSLYREVEATSVTSLAPRARDRALHAPLVALDPSLRDRRDGQRKLAPQDTPIKPSPGPPPGGCPRWVHRAPPTAAAASAMTRAASAAGPSYGLP